MTGDTEKTTREEEQRSDSGRATDSQKVVSIRAKVSFIDPGRD